MKLGQTLKYKVTVKLDPDLHIYNISQPGLPGNGPIPTAVDLFDTGTLRPSKQWTASKDPVVKPEPTFGDNVITEYFEDEVTWSVKLQAPADATPGKHVVRSQIVYQICNQNSCYPPVYQTLADVAVNVVAGDGSAANVTAATQPIVAETKPPAPTPAAKVDQPTEATTAQVETAPPSGPSAEATASATAARADAPISEIARTAQQGLIPFLIASALGGLLALVMPCVWPMVPITVNFFVKQGQAKARARRPAWRSPIAWRSSASSRRSASSSRSSSRPRSSRTWPTTRG